MQQAADTGFRGHAMVCHNIVLPGKDIAKAKARLSFLLHQKRPRPSSKAACWAAMTFFCPASENVPTTVCGCPPYLIKNHQCLVKGTPVEELHGIVELGLGSSQLGV